MGRTPQGTACEDHCFQGRKDSLTEPFEHQQNKDAHQGVKTLVGISFKEFLAKKIEEAEKSLDEEIWSYPSLGRMEARVVRLETLREVLKFLEEKDCG